MAGSLSTGLAGDFSLIMRSIASSWRFARMSSARNTRSSLALGNALSGGGHGAGTDRTTAGALDSLPSVTCQRHVE